MTLHQIMEHKRNGLTVKVNGQDGKVTDVDWRNEMVTVALFDGTSVRVSWWDLTTEWTGGAWNPPAAPAPADVRELETLAKTVDGMDDAELSALVLSVDLPAFCKAHGLKTGKKKDYRGAAWKFCRELRAQLSMLQ